MRSSRAKTPICSFPRTSRIHDCTLLGGRRASGGPSCKGWKVFAGPRLTSECDRGLIWPAPRAAAVNAAARPRTAGADGGGQDAGTDVRRIDASLRPPRLPRQLRRAAEPGGENRHRLAEGEQRRQPRGVRRGRVPVSSWREDRGHVRRTLKGPGLGSSAILLSRHRSAADKFNRGLGRRTFVESALRAAPAPHVRAQVGVE